MADNDLNEMVEEVVQDSDVITVPIDDTLTNSGEAADAKAVGDALALKADKSEIQTAVKVNGQSADAQGLILVNGTHIPMTSSDATTVKDAIDAAGSRTADVIMMSSAQDAQTVAAAISDAGSRTAAQIPMSGGDLTTVGQKIGGMEEDLEDLQTTVAGLDEKTAADIPYSAGGTETIKEHVDGIAAVKTVNEIHPDANGNVDLQVVPYAENLHSDTMQEIDETFLIRTTAGEGSVSDGEAWALRIMGNRVHNGYVAESLQLQVIPMPRSAPAAITASINQATFLAAVSNTTGTYTFGYTTAWALNGSTVTMSNYGITITNDPVNGDEIVVVVTQSGSTYTASMTVNAVPRTAPPEITATIDRDTFVAYVDQSSTILLTYTTEWSANPALYGITVTNDPIAGDQIKVVYVKEVRGTIVVAEPTELVGTGWNLYDHTNGYARVVKYANLYKIGGTYTSIAFADEPDGVTTAITPDMNGLFDLPHGKTAGYVIVTGGNGTNTYITCAWTDWTGGYTGDWQAYSETSIDLSSVYGEGKLEHGLLRAGDVRDEIDLNMKRCYSRIERIAYSDEARAAAAATGRAYEFDENYIYLEKETADVFAVTLSEEYTVSEHGLEWFDGDGDVGVYAEILYGQNLKDKLKRDVLTISEQTLTAGEKAQVQANLNVPDATANNTAMNALADGLGIVANGNTHAAVASGEYVYVRNHSTLADGLYTANAAIAQNETLTTSNLTADAKGGLNALNLNLTSMRYNALTSGSLKTWAVNTSEGFTCFRYNNSVTDTPCDYGHGYIVHYGQNIRVVVFDMVTVVEYSAYSSNGGSSWSSWDALNGTQNVTSSINVSSTKGTISSLAASRTGNVVSIAFVLTLNQNLAVDASVGCTATFSNSALKPVFRQSGSASIKQLSGVNIDPTSSGANLNAVANAALSSSNAMWLTYTYICVG